jgi:hypothetical protein
MKTLSVKTLGGLGTLVLLLTFPPIALAQQTATVTGIVSDASGAVLPGVDVTATNTNTGIAVSRVTTEAGSYTVPALQPGPYRIVAALPGFREAVIQVNLTPNQVYRFNFKLEVGTVATTVEVVSDADALLATTTSSVGDALPEKEVFSLPLATRDVFDLLDTTAGLVRSQEGDATNFAGTRVSAVNTTRDGIVVSDGRYLDWNGAYAATYSSPDLVEEVQVSVGAVDAEAGRGSSQVRLQTRSGTNEYHGALFWTTNNSALNANSWFNNLSGRPKNWTNRNQYGGRLGGPIIRNKAFFFVLIDNQRYLTRSNVTGVVWTEQARQGLFRYWPGAENRNYLQGATRSVDFFGNPVRPPGATGDLRTINLFSDVGDPLRTGISKHPYILETLRRMPKPNDFTTGDGLNTAGITWVRRTSGIDNAAGTSQDTNRDQLNLRFDYQLTANNKLSFIMSREHNLNDSLQASWPGGFDGYSTRNPRTYTASWTATINPTMLNEFRFGNRVSSWHGRTPFSDECCFGSDPGPFGTTKLAEETVAYFSKSKGYPYLPDFNTLTGNKWLVTPSLGASRSQISPLYQFSDTFSWVKGKHSFKAGWEGIWANSDGWNSGALWPAVNLGSGNFRPDIQGRFPGLANADATRAENILNDLAGSIGGVTQGYLVNRPGGGFDDILVTAKQLLNFHQDDWAAFFKDSWNASQNLTLNYGVRWDVYGLPYEKFGLNTAPKDGNVWGISNGGQLTQIITVGKNSLNPDIQLYPKDWNNVSPSFGFSYRVPWIGRTTVLRGGYGFSYNGAATFLQYDFGPGRNPGKTFTGSLTPTAYTALPGSTFAGAAEVPLPLPVTIEPFGTIPLTDRRQLLTAYAPDRRIPYVQNFNLSLETEIAPNTNLSLAWIGTKGTSLWGGRELNEPSILGNGLLEAFNITRGGGTAPLLDQMFRSINFGAGTCGTVNGTTCTASQALRQWTQTRNLIANGEAGEFARFINQSNALTGQYGGFLRRNGFAENFIVVNPQFNAVNLYDNNDGSTYHALQTQVTKRYSSEFSGQFTYTWAKSLGNTATATFRAREDQSFWTRDPQNRSLQKGLLPFHRTHQFVGHGIWELPFGPGRPLGSSAPNWVHRLIERWQLSSVFNWSSGQPISLLNAAAGALGGGGLRTLGALSVFNTPDLVAGIDAMPKSAGKVNVGNGVITYLDGYTRVAEPVTSYYGTNPDGLERYANLWQIVDSSGNVVLRNPKPGTTGNLSANWLEGPENLRLDVALSKAVQIREGTTLTFRMDAVNVLNTPIWGAPNLNINDANFGRITTASGARTFTFNARVDF